MGVARKFNRLAPGKYVGKNGYFLTLTTASRAKVFVEQQIVDAHVAVLGQTADALGFDVVAYCFMPDHMHLLVFGRNDASDGILFVKQYKQATGFAYKQSTGRQLWQKSFYDHILRKQEDVMECAKYILANPVRKGLVDHARDYPYSGSLVYGDAIFNGIAMEA